MLSLLRVTFCESRDLAARLGTRSLPLTEEPLKEILPVVDKPAIHWVVGEAIAAGATRLLGYAPKATFEEGMKDLAEWGRGVEATDFFDSAYVELRSKDLVQY